LLTPITVDVNQFIKNVNEFRKKKKKKKKKNFKKNI